MAEIALRDYIQQIEKMIEEEAFQEAGAHLKHILKHFPKHLDSYRSMAQVLLERNRFLDAGDLFQRVLSVEPDDFLSHLGMSVVNEDSANLQEAIWHMERAYEIQPNHGGVQEELKRLYGERDRQRPERIRLTRGALARLYARGNLLPQAIAEIRAALAEDPQNIGLEVLLAQCLWVTGESKEALHIVNKVLKELPYCWVANRIKSHIEMDNGGSSDNVHRQRLIAVDPYAEFLTTNEKNLTTDHIPANTVRIEALDYVASPDADSDSQPGWMDSVGVSFGDSQTESESPDWLRDASAALAGEALPGLGTGRIASINEGGESPLPEWLSEDPSAVPDWLRTGAAAPTEDDPFAADVPDWMTDDATAGSPADVFPTDDAHIPDWLREEERGGQTPAASDAGAPMPDWMNDETASRAAPSQPTATPKADEPDDFLEIAAPDEELASIFASQAEATSPEEEEPDYSNLFEASDDADFAAIFGADVAADEQSPDASPTIPEAAPLDEDDFGDIFGAQTDDDETVSDVSAEPEDELAGLFDSDDPAEESDASLAALFAESAAESEEEESEEIDDALAALFADSEADFAAETDESQPEDEPPSIFDADADDELASLFAAAEKSDTKAEIYHELGDFFQTEEEEATEETVDDEAETFEAVFEPFSFGDAVDTREEANGADAEDDAASDLFSGEEIDDDLAALFSAAEESDASGADAEDDAASDLFGGEEIDDDLAALFNAAEESDASGADAEDDAASDLFGGEEIDDDLAALFNAAEESDASDEDDAASDLFSGEEIDDDLAALFNAAEESDASGADAEDDAASDLFGGEELDEDLAALFNAAEASDTVAETPQPEEELPTWLTEEDDTTAEVESELPNWLTDDSDVAVSEAPSTPTEGEEFELPDWLTADLDPNTDIGDSTLEMDPVSDSTEIPEESEDWRETEIPEFLAGAGWVPRDPAIGLDDYQPLELEDDDSGDDDTTEHDLSEDGEVELAPGELPEWLSELKPADLTTPGVDAELDFNALFEDQPADSETEEPQTAAADDAELDLEALFAQAEESDAATPPADELDDELAAIFGDDTLGADEDQQALDLAELLGEAETEAPALDDEGELDLAALFARDEAASEESDAVSETTGFTAEATESDPDMDSAVADLMAMFESDIEAAEDEESAEDNLAALFADSDDATDDEAETAVGDLAGLFDEPETPAETEDDFDLEAFLASSDEDSDETTGDEAETAVDDLADLFEEPETPADTEDDFDLEAFLASDDEGHDEATHDEAETAVGDLAGLFEEPETPADTEEDFDLEAFLASDDEGHDEVTDDEDSGEDTDAISETTAFTAEATESDPDMDSAVADLMAMFESDIEAAEDEESAEDKLAALFAEEDESAGDDEVETAVGDLAGLFEEPETPAVAEDNFDLEAFLANDDEGSDDADSDEAAAVSETTAFTAEATESDPDMDSAVADLLAMFEEEVDAAESANSAEIIADDIDDAQAINAVAEDETDDISDFEAIFATEESSPTSDPEMDSAVADLLSMFESDIEAAEAEQQEDISPTADPNLTLPDFKTDSEADTDTDRDLDAAVAEVQAQLAAESPPAEPPAEKPVTQSPSDETIPRMPASTGELPSWVLDDYEDSKTDLAELFAAVQTPQPPAEETPSWLTDVSEDGPEEGEDGLPNWLTSATSDDEPLPDFLPSDSAVETRATAPEDQGDSDMDAAVADLLDSFESQVTAASSETEAQPEPPQLKPSASSGAPIEDQAIAWLLEDDDEDEAPVADEPATASPPFVDEPETPTESPSERLKRAREKARERTDETQPTAESKAAEPEPEPTEQAAEPQTEPEIPAPVITNKAKAPVDDLLAAARSALFNQPNTAIEYYAELVKREKKLDQVIHDLEQWTPREKPAAALQLLGDAYMKSGKLQQALDYYQQALKRI